MTITESPHDRPTMSFPSALYGQRVRIFWRCRDSLGYDEQPWETYRVLGFSGEWVRMIGVDDPTRPDERTTHGMPWWVRAREIEEIEEMAE